MLNGKVAVVGQGFVGNAVTKGYTQLGITNIQTYDINGSGNCSSLEELVKSPDIKYIFICLPTPMVNNKPDFSIVEDTVHAIDDIRQGLVIIIKSTVLPSVLTALQYAIESILVMNPEFLTQRTAEKDFLNPTRIIWGCDNEDILEEIHLELGMPFFNCPDYLMTLEDAAKAKYAINCFAALKINFFNMMNDWCYDFDKVRASILDSGWVNEQHTQVPGHDGKYGFGGACFPKDLNALIHELENKTGVNMLKETFKSNEIFRKRVNAT